MPWITAAATTATTHAGARTRTARRHVSCGNSRRGAGSPRARTRSRTATGASAGKQRSSRTSSSNSRSKSTVSDAGIAHHLLESFQGAAEPRRARGLTDPEQPRRGRTVELEQHSQGDDLALGRGQLAERRRERAFAPRGVVDVRHATRIAILASNAPFLSAEVVERDVSCDPAQPGARSSAPRIELAPGAERVLERLPCQSLGDRALPGEEQHVAGTG